LQYIDAIVSSGRQPPWWLADFSDIPPVTLYDAGSSAYR